MNYKFTINGQNLKEEEHCLFNNFLLQILSKPHTRIIYRGESIDNLKNKLNIYPHENLLDKLNYFIFKIGEKGRVYQKQYFENLKSKSLFSINETTERFYRYIFSKINHVITKSKDSEILKFKSKNPKFIEYFQNKNNRKEFVSKVLKLDSKEQIVVRDYYLSMLHRVGYLGFYLNTFMLSTTLSKKVAKGFTTKEDIIFVSWRTLRFSLQRKLIDKYQFPKYITTLFPYQNEISLKGGLFPQDIIGFIDRKENVFHINPNLFNYPNLIDYMILNGIPVDQNDFNEVRAKTNYSGFFTNDGIELSDNITCGH